jgi:hypothetical protein
MGFEFDAALSESLLAGVDKAMKMKASFPSGRKQLRVVSVLLLQVAGSGLDRLDSVHIQLRW